MSEHEFLLRAITILRNMSLERKGWRGWFSRWYISDEPLRNDAANLLRASEFDVPRLPAGTQMVGDDMTKNKESAA